MPTSVSVADALSKRFMPAILSHICDTLGSVDTWQGGSVLISASNVNGCNV